MTTPAARVLVLGLDPSRVPGPWDPAPVAAAIEVGRARFDEHGVAVEYCLVGLDGSDDVDAVLTARLSARAWECVVVGGGIGTVDGLSARVLDLVATHAPGAAIARSTTPETPYDAAAPFLRRHDGQRVVVPVRTTTHRARRIVARTRRRAASLLVGRGPGQTTARRAADASAYWTDARDDRWESNSHFRDSDAFADDGTLWERVGREHLELVRTAARAAGWSWDRPRVVDWGCGGGANAVAVAPHARELVLVDLSRRTLAEAARQVAAASSTPTELVEADVDAPEAVLDRVSGADLFLCFYVLELVPSQEHGARILRVAADALVPGGLAVLQFKYDDGARASRPRRRGYVRNLADMTTYGVAEFWELAVAAGLRPVMLTLVPENELDRRYAYLAAVKPTSPPT